METDPFSLLGTWLLLAIPSLEVWIGILMVLALLLCSALVSGSEVAFFSLTHRDYDKLELDNSRSSQLILHLKDQPRRLLATILISNNFINIAIVILSEFVLLRLLPNDLLQGWSTSLMTILLLDDYFSVAFLARVIGFLITVVGVTFLLVLFGEVAPKIYAKLNNIFLARLMSRPLFFLMRVFRPFSRLLVSFSQGIERRLEARHPGGGVQASRADFDEAIELTVSHEKDAAQEVDILKSIVKFGDVSVKQIMRSRVDVVAVDFRIGFHELLQIVRESGYSRIPVYDDDFDNVTGILYVKDLIGHLNDEEGFEWQELIRTNVLYVPEAKKISDLLKDFQREHLHMAIVVDEYGGSAGIVTLEDIMEEVIGEIKDEFDDESELIFRRIDEYNYVFEGKTLLNDACRVMGLDTSTFDEVKGDSDSLAGLILELYGSIPPKDTEIKYNHFTFRVVSVSKRRIEQLKITLPKYQINL